MKQILFHLHLFGRDIPIYGYGLMLVIGFFSASYLARYLARRRGLNGDLFMNAALLALLTGVIGARLCHVIENWPDFSRADRTLGENLLNMINIRSGGLTFYGGFLLAFPTLVWYAIHKKVPLSLGMDLVAPCIMIGYGFGRLGCFLNGCCYGAECNLPWAVEYPYRSIPYVEQVGDGKFAPPRELLKPIAGSRGTEEALKTPADAADNPHLLRLMREQHSRPTHPTQLYSAGNCFLIAGLLLAYLTFPHVSGHVFALMLMLEGMTRFLIELLRVEPAVLWGMSLSMVIGLIIAATGAALWIVFSRRNVFDDPQKLTLTKAGNPTN